jgi:glycosyltransferase involved in cell wall biosynthesis
MTAISIVIPVYNSEKYLQHFVDSLQAQTCKDFEALFIDDASTDGSAELISGLAAADPRLKLHKQPKNLGAGAARNLGIRAAIGETLCFADSDDFLPKNSL